MRDRRIRAMLYRLKEPGMVKGTIRSMPVVVRVRHLVGWGNSGIGLRPFP